MAKLGKNSYGKSRVRLSRIMRRADRHDFDEWTVSIMLEGDFSASYINADNGKVLPTDTMKNTVYFIARRSVAETIEEFAMELGDYLIDNHPQIEKAMIKVEAEPWERLCIDGNPEPTTFRIGGSEHQTVQAERMRNEVWKIVSGINGLSMLKTTNSAFVGYERDKLTTLKPATDRILGTCATVEWEYGSPRSDFARVRSAIINALTRGFAAHGSASVQHTLFDLGKAALEATPEITRIHLSMPNLHHLLADLTPFGQDNPNYIFVPIDEPHGTICATVER
jgi:urate oxidase